MQPCCRLCTTGCVHWVESKARVQIRAGVTSSFTLWAESSARAVGMRNIAIGARGFSLSPWLKEHRIDPPRRVFQLPASSTISYGTKSLSSIELDDDNPLLAYEILQGPLVRWTRPGVGVTPPTAVMVHGILGSRRNMQSFARLLLEGFPSWQVLLLDLRCHGESVGLPSGGQGPHTVHTAASDILALLRNLKIFPHTLIGHSFGGKVVMGMIQQFERQLPRPVQVWVLDALPGEVRAGDVDGSGDPARLIEFMRGLPMPIKSRSQLVGLLTAAGFSKAIAQWVATNLRPANSAPGVSSAALTWSFDLDGIRDLYRSYEQTNLYPLLERPPQGMKLDFVKAEHSGFKWAGDDERRIEASGHRVHLLPKAGHWVHTDNPQHLFEILSPSFGRVDLQQRRPVQRV